LEAADLRVHQNIDWNSLLSSRKDSAGIL